MRRSRKNKSKRLALLKLKKRNVKTLSSCDLLAMNCPDKMDVHMISTNADPTKTIKKIRKNSEEKDSIKPAFV